MPPIRIQGLTKRYKDGPLAVDHVDLDIRDGEFMVLVGPSGCGKSTMLQMLAGIVEVSEGTIHIGDRDVTRLDPRKRDIAMVFQSYALYPHLSVRGNLGFGLKLRGTDKGEIARRVEEVARILGLDELLDRKPAALSGGQRQRVAMGRAIAREPARVPDGRAALEPRRQAARLDAGAAEPAARAARHHDRLRDPRPGRGDDARRPRRGHAARRAAAVRHAAGAVQPAGEPVRRGVHRLARDEPRRGRGAGRRGALRLLPDRRSAAARALPGKRDPRAAAARPRARGAGHGAVVRAHPGARSRSSRSSAPRRSSSSGSTRRGCAPRPCATRSTRRPATTCCWPTRTARR